jgi:hypothetical protein
MVAASQFCNLGSLRASPSIGAVPQTPLNSSHLQSRDAPDQFLVAWISIVTDLWKSYCDVIAMGFTPKYQIQQL